MTAADVFPDAPSPVSPSAGGTLLAFRNAVEQQDLDAILNAMSPDVVLRSPITTGFSFGGHDQLRALYEAVFATFTDFHVTEEIAGQNMSVLVVCGHVAKQEFEEVQLLRFDKENRVCELTIFFRPLPALPALADGLLKTLIAPRSRMRGLILKALIGPLVLMTRLGDRLVARLVGGIPGLTSPPPSS
jgi:SnoaL-like domain